MTLGTTPPLKDYIENGVTLIHPVPFEFQGVEEIVCQRINGSVITPCVQGADFTVTGGGGDPGSVTKTNGGVGGTVFRIKRVTTRGQPTDFVSHDSFPAEDVGIAADRLAAVNQEQEIETSDLEGRTVRVPLGETIAALPPPADRKGTLFGFNVATGIRELLTYANASTLLAPFLTPLLSAINKGDPGGNVMAIGLFLAGATLNIPGGTNIVETSGYSLDGKGSAKFQYDAAVDAAYVAAHPRTAFISANARGFRLSLDQQVNTQMFGAIGDDLANDGAAFVAAIAFSYDHGQIGGGNGRAGPSIAVPFGKYYLGAQTLDFTHIIDFFGLGAGWDSGVIGGATLRWDDGCDGLRTQANDTSGATATGVQTWTGAFGSTFSNLYLRGGYAGVEGEFCAFRMRAKAYLTNVCADNWSGDGIAIIAGGDVGGGNCNLWRLNNCQAHRCRVGVFVNGADSNRGTGLVDVSNNRWRGIWDSSFLGNTWAGLCEATGTSPGPTPVMVSYNHNWFAARVNQEAGCAINPPPLTATDNDWWYFCNAGEVNPGANVPAWFNGIVVRAGGPVVTDSESGQTLIFGFGTEIDQPPMQLVPPTLVVGGWQGAGVKGVSWIRSDGGVGTVIDRLRVPLSSVFGPQPGDLPSDSEWIFQNYFSQTEFLFRRWTSVVASVIDASIRADASGLSLTGKPVIQLFADPGTGAVLAGTFTEDGLNLNVGKVLKANGAQVVGEQFHPIGDPAGGAVIDDVARATLASVLDALRTHGLIAT